MKPVSHCAHTRTRKTKEGENMCHFTIQNHTHTHVRARAHTRTHTHTHLADVGCHAVAMAGRTTVQGAQRCALEAVAFIALVALARKRSGVFKRREARLDNVCARRILVAWGSLALIHVRARKIPPLG